MVVDGCRRGNENSAQIATERKYATATDAATLPTMRPHSTTVAIDVKRSPSLANMSESTASVPGVCPLLNIGRDLWRKEV